MHWLLLKPGQFRMLMAFFVLIGHLTIFRAGALGVILFFLLSGYWISDLWTRQETGKLSAKTLGGFFLNRFLRIWPLYILAVLFAAYYLHRELRLANWLILGVASQPGVRPLGVEWSLDIEAQFYIILPFLLSLRPSAWLAVPAIIVGWLTYHYTGINNVLMYLPAFGGGMLLYKYKSSHILISWLASALLFTGLTIALLFTSFGRSMLLLHTSYPISESLFAMIWGAPLIFYVAHSLRIQSSKFDRHLGNISYPLYLIHEPLIQMFRPHGAIEKVGLVVAIVTLSVLIYVIIDRPIENYRYAVLRKLRARNALRNAHGATSSDPAIGTVKADLVSKS